MQFSKICLVISTLFWLSCLLNNQQAQAQYYGNNSEVGFWVGTANYFGDLNPNFNLTKVRPAVGAIYRYTLNPYMAVKGTVGFAQLAHADSISNNHYTLLRNLSFKTDVLEASAQLELHFTKFIAGSEKHYLSPYLTAGIALFHFNPKADYRSETYTLQEVGTEGQTNTDFTGKAPYKRVQLAIPLGIGLKYWMRKNWNFFFELAYRQTFTDYVDDVHGEYIDQNFLGGGGSIASILSDRSDEGTTDVLSLGEPGRQRGDITNNDGYLIFNVGLTYTIFSKKCKPIR